MEDDEYPAHPNKIATSQSLKKALEKEKTSRRNAEYLIRKSVELLKDRTDDPSLDLPDAVKVIGNSHTLGQKDEEECFFNSSTACCAITWGKSPGEEGMPEPVVLVQPPHEPSAEVTRRKSSFRRTCFKGLENLISTLNSMELGTREKLFHCLAQERQQAAMRRHRLQGIAEEFRSRAWSGAAHSLHGRGRLW